MVSLDDAVVARMARHGITFEILVGPDETQKLLEQESFTDDELLAVLAIDDVFTHWSDGKRASDEELEKAFETKDIATIGRRILDEGEIQLTQEQRKKMLASKEKRIVDSIARNTWNPQAKMPHPRERIERALTEAKFRVDPMRRVSTQVEEAIKLLKPLMPIAVERVNVAVKIPAEFTGKAYGQIRQMAKVTSEEWQNDGSLVVVLEMPAGAQTEVYDALNGLTQGNVETKLLT